MEVKALKKSQFPLCAVADRLCGLPLQPVGAWGGGLQQRDHHQDVHQHHFHNCQHYHHHQQPHHHFLRHHDQHSSQGGGVQQGDEATLENLSEQANFEPKHFFSNSRFSNCQFFQTFWIWICWMQWNVCVFMCSSDLRITQILSTITVTRGWTLAHCLLATLCLWVQQEIFLHMTTSSLILSSS